MKLILNSRGLNTKTGTEQIGGVIKGNELKDKKIFICSYPEYEMDESIRENCIRLGFVEDNILFSKNGVPREAVSYVYVTEGNTFEILNYMRKQEFCTFIIRACKAGSIYIGSSAGACVTGKDVKVALDFDTNYVGLQDFAGLHLIDGAVVPHYTESQIKQYIARADYRLISSYKTIYNVDNDNVLILNT